MTPATCRIDSPHHTAGTRRRLLAAALLPLAALGGCGFELRRAPQFSFKSVSVPGKTVFSTTLRRQLRAAGTVEVIEEGSTVKPEAIVETLAETRNVQIVTTNTSGQVRDLQLRFTLRFRVRTADGRELLEPTAITQTRDITYNETAALAKEGETELLYRDMQTDIAQQALRRLAAIKGR